MAAVPLVAYPAAISDRSPGPFVLLGALGVAVALAGAAVGVAPLLGLGLGPLIGLGLGALAAEYTVVAAERDSALDLRSVVWAGGLLLVAELCFLGLELRTAAPTGGGLVMRRLGTVLGLVTGSVVLGAVLLMFASVEPSGGLALQLLGVAAVVSAFALLLTLARR